MDGQIRSKCGSNNVPLIRGRLYMQFEKVARSPIISPYYNEETLRLRTFKYADQIDGFLKVTPKAICNIARGLSLHFRTVNIRSIVVEGEALIENTRG